MSDSQSIAKYREVTARMTSRVHLCVVCRKRTAKGADAMRLKQSWAQLEFDVSKRGRCKDVLLETILQVRALLGLDRNGIKRTMTD
jgi:hypothetical protein